MCPVRQTTLRLLPLCLAISGAVRAEDLVQPTWVLCSNQSTIPLFKDVSTDAVERQSAPTDIDADLLDVKKSEQTIFSGNVELEHADQWMATDKITFAHETEQYQTQGPVR